MRAIEKHLKNWIGKSPSARDAYHRLAPVVRRATPMQAYRIAMFLYTFGYVPPVTNPETFNEKVLYKSLFDKRPLTTIFCDKILVRDYVRKKLKEAISFPKIYKTFSNADDMEFSDIPIEFIMKANHGSGWNIFIMDGEKYDEIKLRSTGRKWLSDNFFNYTKEWCYKNVKPFIIFEELLRDGLKMPMDYKFYCFNGVPKVVQVHYDRFGRHTSNFYDVNWNLVDGAVKWPNRTDIPERPKNLDQMWRISEVLSSDTDFIRVDLYNINGKIYFGELTNLPYNGLERFTPKSFDKMLGDCWVLPKRYESPWLAASDHSDPGDGGIGTVKSNAD